MILVFAPRITNRTRYVMELIFKTLLGFDFSITNNAEVYSNHVGARINYSNEPLAAKEVFIAASGFIESRGINGQIPELATIKGLKCLFPNTNTKCQARFDPFAAAFYLVTRYEEHTSFVGDKHGRFKAEESFAYKNGFLQTPLANHYALLIKALILEKFPETLFPPLQYSFIPTYDVDVAYAYRGRGVLRNVGATLKDLVLLKPGRIKERIKVLRGQQPDPFDSYNFLLDIDKENQLKSFFFFLCGDYGPHDRNVSPYSNVFVNLVKKVGDYAFCGIHPSYESNKNPWRLAMEKKRLSKVLSREIRFSRQHFLKFRLPHTYQTLLQNNIDHDFSMGYPSQPGFRASVATPYYYFDLQREESTSLKIFPLAVMDSTLINYLKLEPPEALQRVLKIVDEVKKVNGTFISLWHNDTFVASENGIGWKDCYLKIVDYAKP